MSVPPRQRSGGTILGRAEPAAPAAAAEDEPQVERRPEAPSGPDAGATSAVPSPSRTWPLVACVIMAAAALILALLGVQQRNALQAERDQNKQLREVSGRTVAALTSYDYQHLDVWKKAVLANLTGKFQNDFESSVAGFEQVYVAEHNRGVGTVQGVWVGQVSAGKATTVVLVQFTITSLTGTHSLQPYVQLTLLKVAGRWRVDDVQYTVDTGGGSASAGTTGPVSPAAPTTSTPAP